jgi:hypothetical protein
MPLSRCKKGQSAFEYAIIVGLALLILLPLWININNSLGATQTGLQSSYAHHAVSKLKGAADSVFVQGSPAKFTMLVTMPNGVDNVTIGNNEISIRLSTPSGITDVVATTLGPVQGSIGTSPGAHRVVVAASGSIINITEG